MGTMKKYPGAYGKRIAPIGTIITENDKQTGAETDEKKKQNSVIQTGNFPGYSLMREF